MGPDFLLDFPTHCISIYRYVYFFVFQGITIEKLSEIISRNFIYKHCHMFAQFLSKSSPICSKVSIKKIFIKGQQSIIMPEMSISCQ